MRRNWLLIGVVVLVVLAGCSSITGDDGGSSADWCGESTAQGFQMVQSGEQVTVDVEGVVEREGQSMCHVQYEYASGQRSQYGSADFFFTEGGESFEVIYYDENGNQISSFSGGGGMGVSGSGSSDSGGMTTTSTTTGGSDDGGVTVGTTGGSDGGGNTAGAGSDDGGVTVGTTGGGTGGDIDPAGVEGTIGYGATVTGTLDGTDGVAGQWRNARADAYQFQGSAGDSVVITMESDPIDTYLILEGPGGNRVTWNDDGGIGLNSQLGTTLPADGTYTIWATTFTRARFGNVNGQYTLSLSQS